MRKHSFFKNKYTLLALILLLLLAVDVVSHKGMTRVLLPDGFPADLKSTTFTPLRQPLSQTGMYWKKAVNSREAMEALPADVAGLEMDVYFDTARNIFKVYHDSAALSEQSLEGLLEIYQKRNLSGSIWLDFKNLSSMNEKLSLNYLVQLREKFALQQKIIVESTHPQYLQSFNIKDFFTSYYTPYFNPYQIDTTEFKLYVDSISATVSKHNVSALSGYYFQLPALKKYFPSYPLLSWSDRDRFSMVSFLFHNKLKSDANLKVLLFP